MRKGDAIHVVSVVFNVRVPGERKGNRAREREKDSSKIIKKRLLLPVQEVRNSWHSRILLACSLFFIFHPCAVFFYTSANNIWKRLIDSTRDTLACSCMCFLFCYFYCFDVRECYIRAEDTRKARLHARNTHIHVRSESFRLGEKV